MSEKNRQTVQEKIAALQELTAWFEGDSFELEQALEKFKQAQKLADEIEQDLKNLHNEVTVLRQQFDREA